MTKNYQTKRPRAATLEPEIVLPETVNIAMAVRGQAHGHDSPEGVTRETPKGSPGRAGPANSIRSSPDTDSRGRPIAGRAVSR